MEKFKYICPFCGTIYEADNDEILDYEDWECPGCETDVSFNGSEYIKEI
jgi:rubredoxin